MDNVGDLRQKAGLVISLDARFVEGEWGVMGESARYGQGFFREALGVFDSVWIAARVARRPKPPRKDLGMDPSFLWIRFPSFQGIWKGIGLFLSLIKRACTCSGKGDIHLLRVPGTISTLIWPFLIMRRKKYGVEVIGLAIGSVNSPGSVLWALISVFFDVVTKLQCRYAVAASYVSKKEMPVRYPCRKRFFAAGVRLPEGSLGQARRYTEPPEPLRLVHIGTMHTLYKGQDILLRAVKRVLEAGQSVLVTLVGEGMYRPDFERLAREFEVAEYVHFVGSLPGGWPVMNLLDRSDILVFPSRAEGLPNVIIEAMARGLPVIATEVGGIPELIDREYLVPAGDAESLCEKLIQIGTDAQALSVMSRKNIRRAEDYLAEKLARIRTDFFTYLRNAAAG